MRYQGKRVARLVVKVNKRGVEIRVMSPGSNSGQYASGVVRREDGDVGKAFADLWVEKAKAEQTK